MDNLPLPDYRVWKDVGDKQNVWLPVQSRRGCSMRCSYCSTETIEGAAVRKMSPEKVVSVIAAAVELGFGNFYFTDNTFNFPAAYAKQLCSELIKSGLDIKWRCIIYPKNIDDELAGLLARAGCVEASLGFESGCDAILKNMNKKFTKNDVREVNKLLADHGIRRHGFLMLGGPGETKATVKESFEFADSLQLNFLKITSGIRIYPDTQLAALAIEEGVIGADDDLLQPKFYLVKELEEWLIEQIDRNIKEKPNWMM